MYIVCILYVYIVCILYRSIHIYIYIKRERGRATTHSQVRPPPSGSRYRKICTAFSGSPNLFWHGRFVSAKGDAQWKTYDMTIWYSLNLVHLLIHQSTVICFGRLKMIPAEAAVVKFWLISHDFRRLSAPYGHDMSVSFRFHWYQALQDD